MGSKLGLLVLRWNLQICDERWEALQEQISPVGQLFVPIYGDGASIYNGRIEHGFVNIS